MKKTVIYTGLFLLAFPLVLVFAQNQPDEKLFQEAKILLFDEKWAKAQVKLEDLIEKFPDSPLFSQAVFYRAKCLSKQKGKEKDAIQTFNQYIFFRDANRSLIEEAENSVIDLAAELYSKGERAFLEEIEDRLSSQNKVVQYYAAFKLSYFKDKRVARKGIPVLQQILEDERDSELRDRAKVALLRIDPDALESYEEEESPERRPKALRFQVFEDGRKKLDIGIPWALADLALLAIPEEEKSALRKKGYNLDRIIDDLTRGKTSLIDIKEGNIVIKIWID